MKKMRMLFSFMLIFSMTTLSIIPFTKDNTAQAANGIYLNETDLTLEVDHYKTLRVGGTSNKASWTSSNSRVVSVSASGKVFAKAPGSATITASISGKRLKCKVNVIFMKENITLTKNQSSTLTVFGAKDDVAYSSNNPSIVTVTDSGKLTAKSTGIATITAYVDGKELTSKVSVIGINENAIVLELNGWSGFIKTLKVNNTLSPVKWSSSNNSIANVAKDGRVRAQGAGTATITATVDGKKFTTSVKVLKASTKEFTLRKNNTKTLQIFGTDNKVKWASNKNSVATVSADGTVTPVSKGTASILGYVDGRKVTITVNVID
jgi:chitinase